MKVNFFKYQGTGNDFIILDNRDMLFDLSTETIAKLCDRHFGIGADGLMLLQKNESLDFTMVYFNADGKGSSMCGNGGRCIVHFAKKMGIVNSSGKFEAIDGIHDFEISDDNLVKLKMNDVTEIVTDKDAFVVETGSPHYVSFIEEIDKLDILADARKVRYNATYAEEGINVNFVEQVNGKIFMRTYERGVEDETLSCGTGTVAVALAVAKQENNLKSPLQINTPGGKLNIHFHRNAQGFSDIWLEGPAQCVFEGVIEIN